MTSVAPTRFMAPLLIAAPPPAAPPGDVTTGTLPKPLMDAAEPEDALAMLLSSIEKSSQASIAESEDKVRATRADIKQQLDSFLEQIRAAIESAKEDSGGFFGDLLGCVADVVGAIVGAVADVFCDYVMLPVDVTVDVVKSAATSQNLWTALQSDLADFGKTGDAGQAVKGFTSGVVKFAGDLAALGAKLSLAMAKVGVAPGEALDDVKGDLKQLANSFDKNILSNPDFWKVMGTVVKAAAVAGTLASGGAMGIVCVALLATIEADKQTGFIQRAAGEKAAPWLRAGLQLAAAVCGGVAGSGGSNLLGTLKTAGNIADGVHLVGNGVKTIVDEHHKADDLDRQADMTATLNRMQQLQRLCEDLLDTLSNKNKDHSTQQEQMNGIYQTLGATETAVVVRA